MFLNKLKNNNRGADIALIGTNYILVLIIICCAILDLTVIEYSKVTVVAILKQSEMYALAKHYDNEEMWNEQEFKLSEEVQNNVRHTFKEQFYSAFSGAGNFIEGIQIADNTSGVGGSGISVTGDMKAMSLIISVPKVHYTPKKILGRGNFNPSPFLSHNFLSERLGNGDYRITQSLGSYMNYDHTVSRQGSDIIVTGASCKIAFIPQ